jgi:phosphoinositide-3-kinase regulatory subunit 4
MTSAEESKLLAMRDYILKLADARARCVCFECLMETLQTYLWRSSISRAKQEPETDKSLKIIGDIELQKLGIVPRTVPLN